MGREKSLIRTGNRHLYEYPLAVLAQLCRNVLISTCNKSYHSREHPQVCDEIPGIGPLGGIYSCLKKSGTDLNIVLSCDMPLVNKDLLIYLLQECAGNDIVVPAVNTDKVEPLCGIYRKTIIPAIEQQIMNKIYAVHTVFEQVSCKIVMIRETMPFYSPHMFMNINDADDLDRLEKILSGKSN